MLPAQVEPRRGTGEHWVDYPKTSVPDDGVYDRARRADRMLLPFAAITPGRPLTLQPDGKFRTLLADAGGDLGKTLDALLAAVDTATDGLSGADGVRQALAEVMEPVRPTLAIAPGDLVEDLVQFRAEGGTVAGLLRALQPTLQMDAIRPVPAAAAARLHNRRRARRRRGDDRRPPRGRGRRGRRLRRPP